MANLVILTKINAMREPLTEKFIEQTQLGML